MIKAKLQGKVKDKIRVGIKGIKIELSYRFKG
jgi:hypothetical protein